MSEFIPVNTPLLDGNEKAYLVECIDSGWVSSEGPFVNKFEQAFASCVSREACAAVSNGTAALEIAIAALEIGPGDEVIMPSFTIISCASAVIRAGATPVLVDCLRDTWNMDVALIEEKITVRTKAIMMIHIYGLSVDVDPVLDIANKHNLYVIEDAAEAIGLKYKGKPCGSFGDISTFSFYTNKLITTGEGGMVATNDKVLVQRCRSLRNLCFQAGKRFIHEELGWNFRMTNMQAALGMAQLENFDKHLNIKRQIGKRYSKNLHTLKSVQLPVAETSYSSNIYWVYGLVIKGTHSIDVDEVILRLSEKGIGSRRFFWPMHEQPVFQKMGLYQNAKIPNSEYLARHGFYVPGGPGLNMEQVDYVSDVLCQLLS